MTADEFNSWWKDYQAKFPSAAKWLNTLADDQRREQFVTWREILSPVSLADAMTVNKLMKNGDVPEVGSFDQDREKTAQVVRSECDALGRRRRSYERGEPGGDRVKCLHCRDTGFVEVFRPKFLAFVAAIKFGVEARQRGWTGRTNQCVICSCEAGEQKIWKGTKENIPQALSKTRLPDVPRYDPERFAKVPPGKENDHAVWREAADWFLIQREKWLDAQYATYGEFTDWNNR